MAWQNLGITHMTMSFKADTKPITYDSKNNSNSKINFKMCQPCFTSWMKENSSREQVE